MTTIRSQGWLVIVLLLGCRTSTPERSANVFSPAHNPSSSATVANATPQEQEASSPINTSGAFQTVDKSAYAVSFQSPVPQETRDKGLVPPVVTDSTPSSPMPDQSDGALPALAKNRAELERGTPENLPAPPPLDLAAVEQSVVYSFPGLQIAMQELGIARGRELGAWGEFDLKLKGESYSAPEGFYQTYRQLVKVEQATMPGGSVFGQYRIGDGNFQPWYGERETNEGGEFKIGAVAALLRDRAVDQRRAAIFVAQLQQRQVEPAVQALLLEFVLAASDAYWSWVAAGRSYAVQQELLRLTEERNRIYEIRVKNNDLAPLELLQNERLIASRQAKLIETERKLQQSAIKLSFFYRDAAGNPLLPPLAQLPAQLPLPVDADLPAEDMAVTEALTNRPELQELRVLRQQVSVDLNLAQNQLLPGLDASLEASKDVGAASSSKRDKTPFELEAGLFLDVPIQRRKATGKIRESQAKLRQLAFKTELTENKIVVQLRDARSALETAAERFKQANQSRLLAERLVEAERLRFENSDSDLFRVALQEATAIEAALIEIEALADYHKARAAWRAALGTLPE
jgi:outer membrane protein TolC